MFGYGIDSPNVNNATDPYYAESDDYYSYGDSYNVVHVGETHGWGCWGGGNPGTSRSRIDRQFLGRYAYVGNYYAVSYTHLVQGTPEELDTMEMSGTFGTAYENFAAALAGRNVSARATASFTSRKAPYKLQVTTTGMRESQVPGDPNAFVANLEYARDNNGNIYYTDAAGNRGIIENGTFKYGYTESKERRVDFDASTTFPLYLSLIHI